MPLQAPSPVGNGVGSSVRPYAEVTPERDRIRIIGTASGPALHRKFSVPKASGMSIEIYRNAERYITVSGVQIGEARQLANIDAQAEAVASNLTTRSRQTPPARTGMDHPSNMISIL